MVERACAGDAMAVEAVISAIERPIYGLAVRMLWHPEDARDATQDILIRIVTHLSSFRGESLFTSWCYAIAANHLRTVQKSRVEQSGYTFESFEAELHAPASSSPDTDDPEYAVAVEEVKIGCTLGMLQCLDREHRLAYILGEIMELDHKEGAEVAGITPAAFRQRLARARKAIVAFTKRVCGIVDERNECRCASRAAYAIETGRVQPGKPLFGEDVRESARRFAAVQDEVRRLEAARRAAALYRSHPELAVPDALRTRMRELLRGMITPSR